MTSDGGRSPSPSDIIRSEIHRVGLVSPAWPPGAVANGIVTYVTNLRAGLAAIGVGSSVIAHEISSRIPAADEWDVVDTRTARPSLRLRALWKAEERLGGLSTLDHRQGAAVASAVRTAHARAALDVVEMEESFGAARFVHGTIPSPLIVRLHGPWCLVAPALGHPDPPAIFRSRVDSEGRGIALGDGVSSPSLFALARVREYYGLPLGEGAVIPNPIAIQPPALRWHRESSDQRSVLFVGRFDRLKGGDVVLDAFARLAAELPEARLVFVGPDRGLRDDTGKTWTFHEYVRAHVPAAIAARIQMLGEQPPGAIAELRRRAFVTMVASRFETFSMTAVEALSHGSPLVVPAAAALVEIVEHGRNGLRFEGGDAGDACRQLLRLFREPGLAERLAAEGVLDAERRFAPEVVARRMRSFYETVRARWRSGPGRPAADGPGTGLGTGPGMRSGMR